MVWFRLALKNLLRRPVRTALTVAGVAVAIAVLYSLLEFQRGYERGLREELNALGAHIMVVPKGCPYEASTIVLHGGKWPRYLQEEYLEKVRAVPGVAESAGILMDAIIAKGADERNQIFLGVDEHFRRLRPNWRFREGGWFADENSLILGANVARELKLRVGDTYRIREPRGNFTVDATFRVAGILEPTATQDDGFYFLPLATVQRVFNLPDRIVVILVKVKDVANIAPVVDALKKSEANMNVFPLTELLSAMGQLVNNTKVFVLAIVLVAIAVGAVGVLNTILMAVFERTREIGMMKAVGASAGDVFHLICAETVLMCASGGLLGTGLALAASRLTDLFIKGVLAKTALISVPKGALIGFSWPVFGAVMLLAVLLGLVAGAYPAWRASAVSPVEAIRGE
ncbi:MAG TPA: ABC transporter permease [Armatimonadetes bacterium]|nr:ABC transporter permease [Armatimonadota bacterium]